MIQVAEGQTYDVSRWTLLGILVDNISDRGQYRMSKIQAYPSGRSVRNR